ncbi:MAG TPA: type II toxin-antitoxin system death-on-curing family toxin [Herpetosiphonaceae bacterium]
MRYLTLNEILFLHQQLIEQLGGSEGVHDLNALESALAQPRMSFGGEDLYPTLEEKAVALGFSLIKNHPFIDGNKRTAHAAMETFLVLNGNEIDAPVEEQEQVILQVAANQLDRDTFTAWLHAHSIKKSSS